MPNSATKASIWKTEAMILRPPEAPSAISGSPAPLAVITGHMLFSGRRPGAMAPSGRPEACGLLLDAVLPVAACFAAATGRDGVQGASR